jgi:hypothetical protein
MSNSEVVPGKSDNRLLDGFKSAVIPLIRPEQSISEWSFKSAVLLVYRALSVLTSLTFPSWRLVASGRVPCLTSADVL